MAQGRIGYRDGSIRVAQPRDTRLDLDPNALAKVQAKKVATTVDLDFYLNLVNKFKLFMGQLAPDPVFFFSLYITSLLNKLPQLTWTFI